MWIRITFILLLIVAVGIAEVERKSVVESNFSQASRDIFSNSTRNIEDGTSVVLRRSKRGWGSIIFTGVSILVRATSLGLSLGQALTEGCLFYPSICSNKQEIERLDKLIKVMTQKYEAEFINSKQTYYDLRTASTNNAYISYYINETIQAVETIQELEESVSSQLELMLPKLHKMYETSQNYSFEKYLETVVGQLEYRLSDIHNMLTEYKRNALVGLAIQYLVEVTVNKFLSSFQTAYNQVSQEEILASTVANLWERMDDAPISGKPGRLQNVGSKLKLAPKAFKQMVRNWKGSFQSIKTGIQKWRRINNWKGFKGKLAHTFRGPISKLQNTKRFFTSASYRKFTVSKYRLTWSQKIMTGVGIIGDVVSQAVSAKQWGQVATEMEKARKNYNEYHDKLVTELQDIEKEKLEMKNVWKDIIEVFKNLSLPFKSLIKNSTQYSNFSDIVGISKLPISIHNPLFSINFEKLNNSTLKESQSKVIGFLREVENNMTKITDEMTARQILYNNTFSKSKAKDSIQDILSDLTSIFRFSTSQTVKNFGQHLTMKDMVCTVSILRPDIDEYDFYPLENFRPHCEVNDSTFAAYKTEAALHQKKKLMLEVIMRKMNTSKIESLSILYDAVQNAYLGVQDHTIAAFGRSVTEKDVVCEIAKQFPGKNTYDFLSLDSFRPECSAVTDSAFSKMKHTASKIRQSKAGVKNDLLTCKNYKFCPCLSKVSETHKITEADVITILKHLDSNWHPSTSATICVPAACDQCKHL